MLFLLNICAISQFLEYPIQKRNRLSAVPFLPAPGGGVRPAGWVTAASQIKGGIFSAVVVYSGYIGTVFPFAGEV